MQKIVLAGVALGALIAPTAASAQSSPAPAAADTPARDSDSDSSEIVVTAQRREEKLIDVPISIAVLGGKQLDKATVSFRDTLNQLPGVNATLASNTSEQNINIRGVTSNANSLFAGAGTVGFYLDGVPFGFVRSGFVPDSNIFDLDRVEVLRGPQGTLFGASSLSGAVRLFTHKANLNDVEAKFQGLVSQTQSGGTNMGADMMINAPIVDGKLALRASGSFQHDSGYIDRSNKADFNDGDRYSLRVKLGAQPTEQLSIELSAWTNSAKAAGRARGTRALTYPTLKGDEPQTSKYDVYSGNIAYDFGAFSLASTTSYVDYRQTANLDYSAYFPAFYSAGEVLFSEFRSKVFTQEVNLASNGAGPWKWSLGAMYRNSDDLLFQLRPGHQNQGGTRRTEASKSYAAYGELTRSFFDDVVELTAGLRYFDDHQELHELSRNNQIVPNPPLVNVRSKFDHLSKRFVLALKPEREVRIYASYSEGFRSGFAQDPLALQSIPTLGPVGEDVLKNYEVGSKGMVAGGLLSYDVAAFYLKWDGIQYAVPVRLTDANGTPFNIGAVLNAQSASGAGFEASATLRPAPGLTFTAGVGYNDLKLDGDVRNGQNNAVILAKGDRLIGSPAWTASGSAQYGFPIGEDLRAVLGVSGNFFTATTNRAIVNGVSTSVKGDNIFMLGGRFSIEAGKGWSAALFVDNLTNTRNTPEVDLTATQPQSSRYRPRTIGLQLGYGF